jgi:hypothetical protein
LAENGISVLSDLGYDQRSKAAAIASLSLDLNSGLMFFSNLKGPPSSDDMIRSFLTSAHGAQSWICVQLHEFDPAHDGSSPPACSRTM